jgi:membrane glycosyltransferase
VAGALALSIPISVFSSRVSLGRRARASRLFLIPEETAPPRELRRTRAYARRATSAAGFIDAVIDPVHNAMACASDIARRRHSDIVRSANQRLVARALSHGPDALDAGEKNALLGDAIALSRLHLDAWESPDAHTVWKHAREQQVHIGHNSRVDTMPSKNLNLQAVTVTDVPHAGASSMTAVGSP